MAQPSPAAGLPPVPPSSIALAATRAAKAAKAASAARASFGASSGGAAAPPTAGLALAAPSRPAVPAIPLSVVQPAAAATGPSCGGSGNAGPAARPASGKAAAAAAAASSGSRPAEPQVFSLDTDDASSEDCDAEEGDDNAEERGLSSAADGGASVGLNDEELKEYDEIQAKFEAFKARQKDVEKNAADLLKRLQTRVHVPSSVASSECHSEMTSEWGETESLGGTEDGLSGLGSSFGSHATSPNNSPRGESSMGPLERSMASSSTSALGLKLKEQLDALQSDRDRRAAAKSAKEGRPPSPLHGRKASPKHPASPGTGRRPPSPLPGRAPSPLPRPPLPESVGASRPKPEPGAAVAADPGRPPRAPSGGQAVLNGSAGKASPVDAVDASPTKAVTPTGAIDAADAPSTPKREKADHGGEQSWSVPRLEHLTSPRPRHLPGAAAANESHIPSDPEPRQAAAGLTDQGLPGDFGGPLAGDAQNSHPENGYLAVAPPQPAITELRPFLLDEDAAHLWDGWTIITTLQGSLFFYHEETNSSQWGPPACLNEVLGTWIEVNSVEAKPGEPLTFWRNDVLGLSLWRDPSLCTNLFQASTEGNLFFLQLYASVNGCFEVVDDYGATALHHASASGAIQSFMFLQERGVDLSARDGNLATPLAWACKYGHAPIVKLLLDQQVDAEIPDNRGDTPLHEAAKTGQVSCMHLLVMYGVKVLEKNMDGETPFDIVTRKRMYSGITLLKCYLQNAKGEDGSKQAADGDAEAEGGDASTKAETADANDQGGDAGCDSLNDEASTAAEFARANLRHRGAAAVGNGPESAGGAGGDEGSSPASAHSPGRFARVVRTVRRWVFRTPVEADLGLPNKFQYNEQLQRWELPGDATYGCG